MRNLVNFRDFPNMTDTSDIHTIIDKEDRKNKAIFFGFSSFFINSSHFFQTSNTKIVSSLRDPSGIK